MESSREVVHYYERTAEESRLVTGRARLEFERTKELITRVLPASRVRILDVGGAAGPYSAWLSELGHEVHLVDLSERLVGEARKINATLKAPIASLEVADARSLPQSDEFADIVLMMGPLYHLTEREDRLAALREAHRVLAKSGTLVVAGISRYASALDGLARNLTIDPAFVAIRDRDLQDGQHRNTTERPDYFTTAYFHRPEDLKAELEAAGFIDARVLGVEGPCWLIADFDARWVDPAQRAELMTVARALESEPTMLGVSAHLLGIARKIESRDRP
jgi:ubiquinone/menaquinone biosynthesis C-methylase UbiE